MRALILLVPFALGACTAFDDFNGFTFGAHPHDLALPGDLGSGGATDLSMRPPGACAHAGQRVCFDSTTSAVCDPSLNPTPDRACPPTSTCQGGYCQPPPAAQNCQRDFDCNPGFDCDLYVGVGNNSLQGFCTSDGGGSGFFYSLCFQPGDDATCNTGLCATDANDVTLSECLYLCQNQSDCPSNGVCRSIAGPLTIEGVTTFGVLACFM